MSTTITTEARTEALNGQAITVVPVGSIVRFEAPGSRGTDGMPVDIPAIVVGQWPEDGNLRLFAFHFEGQFLVNSIPVDKVTPVLSPNLMDMNGPSDQEYVDLLNKVGVLARQNSTQEALVKQVETLANRVVYLETLANRVVYLETQFGVEQPVTAVSAPDVQADKSKK